MVIARKLETSDAAGQGVSSHVDFPGGVEPHGGKIFPVESAEIRGVEHPAIFVQAHEEAITGLFKSGLDRLQRVHHWQVGAGGGADDTGVSLPVHRKAIKQGIRAAHACDKGKRRAIRWKFGDKGPEAGLFNVGKKIRGGRISRQVNVVVRIQCHAHPFSSRPQVGAEQLIRERRVQLADKQPGSWRSSRGEGVPSRKICGTRLPCDHDLSLGVHRDARAVFLSRTTQHHRQQALPLGIEFDYEQVRAAARPQSHCLARQLRRLRRLAAHIHIPRHVTDRAGDGTLFPRRKFQERRGGSRPG